MEFKVGQRFPVPNICWTITAIIGNVVHYEITYEDGSKPTVAVWRIISEFRSIMDIARERGRLIEDHVTVEE
jgi:hypothetical protein